MAAKSGKILLYSTIVVLLVWVISAAIGAIYLVAPSDAPSNPGRTVQTLALIFFAVTTTAIWLGVLVLVLVIAWKWHGGRQQPPTHS